MVSTVMDQNFVPNHCFQEEDLTEDLTIVEIQKPSIASLKNQPKHSSMFLFLSCPHYPRTLQVKLRGYFKEVRVRMIESRDFDRIHYPHTVYQKCRRLLAKTVLRVKRNLSS